MTLNILTTVKYYNELLQKAKIDHSMFLKYCCSKYEISFKNLNCYERRENAVCALCARRERAVNTLGAVEAQWTLYICGNAV